jgi:hypothetical protein
MTAAYFKPKGERAFCFFCKAVLPRPKKRPWNPISLLPGGKCGCGAHFVIDPTGRLGGQAFLEVMEDLCDGDRDRSLTLVRDRDFEEFIENYDAQAHQYIKGFRGYARGMARLYLVRWKPTE